MYHFADAKGWFTNRMIFRLYSELERRVALHPVFFYAVDSGLS